MPKSHKKDDQSSGSDSFHHSEHGSKHSSKHGSAHNSESSHEGKESSKSKHHHDSFDDSCEKSKPDCWPYRRFDGKGNNFRHPEWGSTDTALIRLTTVGYANGKNTLAKRGKSNPNPRVISNTVFQGKFTPHPFLTNLFWVWGQFVDHELDLTEFKGGKAKNIETPPNDPVLPDGIIPFMRSIHTKECGVWEQINQLPAFMDGTNVYGFNDARAYALRALDGTGHLKSMEGPDGPLLPLNTEGLPNAPSAERSDLFIAGDVRSNENSLLACIHTLFMREHNNVCDELVKENPEWKGNDEKIYQEARKIIIGFQQVITYNHFLPILLGPKSRCLYYHGYDPHINPSIANEFSAACYRVGHPMVTNELKDSETGDSLSLRDAFFDASYVIEHGIQGLIGGAASTPMKDTNHILVDDIRSFLFEEPHDGMMMDLASLNIQRGRDHGLPDYGKCRECLGLSPVHKFKQITSNKKLQKKLSKLYDKAGDLDPWVAGICEDHLPCAQVGQLFHAVLDNQFFRARHGDRFWWENQSYPGVWGKRIRKITLREIIKRNTGLKHLPKNVFIQKGHK